MLARYRLWLAIVGISIVIGLVVAVSPIATGQPAHCTIDACWTATNHPEWIAGLVSALAVFALLLRLSPLGRARRNRLLVRWVALAVVVLIFLDFLWVLAQP
jgi:hypothetical protein